MGASIVMGCTIVELVVGSKGKGHGGHGSTKKT